jgi:FkbM family methyltransferase
MKIEVRKYCEIVKNNTKIKPHNLFEIGSRDGHDASLISEYFNIQPLQVHVFEPNPYMFDKITKEYPGFKTHKKAIFNKNGKLVFNAAKDLDDGRSSLYNRDIYNEDNFSQVEVDTVKMSDFIKENDIKSIDLCKLDVEGAALEVLEGFGQDIDMLKSIQIESEAREVWEGQKTWFHIEQFMIHNDFVLVWQNTLADKAGVPTQNDSVWVKREYVK